MTTSEMWLWFYGLPCVVCILFSWVQQIFYHKTDVTENIAMTYIPIANLVGAILIVIVAVGCVGIAIVELPNTIKGLKK